MAVDRVVRADGTGPYETIDDAVGAANDGDVIVLMPGVYTGAGNHGVQVESNITIGAQYDPTTVIIDCQGSATFPQRAFNVVDGNPTFRNLTIMNGYAVDGGAIKVETYTTTINFCRFIDNQAERGGAVYASGADGLNLYGCVLARNRATVEGGGVYAYGEFPVSVEKTTFFRNSSRNGSGLFMSGDASLDLFRTLVVFGRGSKGVGNYYGGPQTAMQSGIWGNTGGDWVDALAPFRGTAGNIEADPQFCDPDADVPNFNVAANSPAWLQPTLIVVGAGARDSNWEAPVYGVSDDGSGMFPTIQAALDTVAVPGEVVLRAGRYQGPGNFALTFGGKDITLRSRNLDAASTVISGSGSQDRVIWLHDGETTAATISHLQIEQGNANMASDYTGYGGGILLTGAEATIRDCIIKWNEAETGANISANNEAYDLVIEDCSLGFANGNGADLFFQGNRLDLTGTSFLNWSNDPDDGMRIGEWAGDVLVDNCVFEHFTEAVVIDPPLLNRTFEFRNTTFRNGQDALIIDSAPDVVVDHCTFSALQNGSAIGAVDSGILIQVSDFLNVSQTLQRGGAMHLDGCDVIVESSRFIGNETDQDGAGIFASDSDLDLRYCTFTDNECLTTIYNANGGALFHSGGTLDIVGCQFEGNIGGSGGAIFCENATNVTCYTSNFIGNQGLFTSGFNLAHSNGNVDMSGNLFATNTSTLGSALYVGATTASVVWSTLAGNVSVPGTAQLSVLGSADLVLSRNIIVDGVGSASFHTGALTGTWDVNCNDIHGNEGGDWVANLTPWLGINGNISVEPYFCDPAGGDFMLQAHSECLDANNTCGETLGAFGSSCPQVSAAPDDRLPQVLTLGGNTPNPFNPRTEIRFTLPAATRVELDIHDVAGRKIQTLIAGEKLAAGAHDAVWNGTDHAGRAVPSGTYLYRVRAGSEVVAGKMVLLR